MIQMSLSSALVTTLRKVWFCFSHLGLVLQIIEVFAFYNTDFCLPPFFFFSSFLFFFKFMQYLFICSDLTVSSNWFQIFRSGVRFFDNCFENNIFWRVEKAADSAFVTCYRDLQPVHALKISCFKTKLIHLWMKIVICIACLHYQLSLFFNPNK